MSCECSECTRMCDPETMSYCKECDEYFCPSCWDDHDVEGGYPDAVAVASYTGYQAEKGWSDELAVS